MTPDQILDKAADLIQFNGHCRYRLKDDQGRYCVNGAINTASYENSEYIMQCHLTDEHVEALTELAHVATPEVVPYKDIRFTLADWNNFCAKDGDEVVEKMRIAAKNYRERVSV